MESENGGKEMTPEDRASRAIAECLVKNKGKNLAFYLAKAIREAIEDEKKVDVHIT